MFIENKYTKWYTKIIESAKNKTYKGYSEKHHIIPRSLGGSDAIDNLVKLSAREHFICHLLLVRMVSDMEHKRKMVYAAWQQSRSSKIKGGKVTSRIYEMLRRDLSNLYTGRKRKPFSEEAKANMKAAAKTRKKVAYSPERIEKLLSLTRAQKGQKLSIEHRDKIALSMVGKSYEERYGDDAVRLKEQRKNQQLSSPVVSCPHCGKTGKGSGMHAWHFNKCRHRNTGKDDSSSQY